MTFVDHLKGTRQEDLVLEVAFGNHVIAGDLAKSIVTGSNPTHIVKVQQMLGEAFGKGWSGPLGVWFRGTNRPAAKYVFHPGKQSSGPADPVQGVDAVFDQDTPHSNTAWLRLECPNGAEVGIPDFDTKENPPTGTTGIYACQLGDIYDDTGTVTAAGVLLVNPADVLAFGCVEIRRYALARVDWAALDTLRAFADETVTPDYTILPVGVGLAGKYYDGAAFDTFKSQRVDPVIQYDISTGAPALNLTPTAFSVRWEGKIRFKYSETTTITVIHNDSVKLWIDDVVGSPVIDQAAAGTHTTTWAATADEYVDVKIEWTNASGDSQFWLQWSSTSVSLQVIPQDRLYPKNEAIPRFRSNIAFTQRTSFDDFLKSVLFTCNGSFQDVNGTLRFFSIDQISSSFDFDEANIVKNTFKSSPRFTQQELLSLPNRFIAEGRDLDSRYLEKFDPQLYYDVTELQELAGRIIEETVFVGNVNRWQGLTNLRHYAKMRTSPRVCEFVGMPQTLPVLPGDRVRLTHSLPGWTDKGFVVLEATDLSIDTAADNRYFKLLLWTNELTGDGDLLFGDGEVLEEDS
ncbi:MAG: hypothetical protein IT173_13215 [Acidobacteria bacterium]|nr:hypothetical protein [Acidobacteriota bacterium]